MDTSELTENPVSGIVYVGSAGGAVSYGLSKLTDFDLITEFVSGSPELAGGAFLVAGGVALASDFDFLEIEEP